MRKDARFAAELLQEALGLTTPRGRLLSMGVLAAGLGLAGPDRLERGPALCLFRLATGHQCPACGMTRALAALLRGKFGLAARYNPVAFLVAFTIIVISARDLLKSLTYSSQEDKNHLNRSTLNRALTLMKPDQPPPSDEEVKVWLAEHRIHKYPQA